MKRIPTFALVLFALMVTACSPAIVDSPGQGEVPLGDPMYGSTPTETPEVPPQANEAEYATAGLQGTWQVTGFVSTSGTKLSTADAQSYIGKKATIRADGISFNGQRCGNVAFQRSKVNLSSVLSQGYAELATKLGLTQSQIDVVQSACTVTGFQTFGQVDPNTLVIDIKGTFFLLHK